ncbi:hypothetical protein TWF481_001383 [Arthrobotrys musiformis]|uniref:Transposase n=1 Tax=Arthrobotrys musiformis TaxID=47236 RepID=A0AAV9WRE7_9PEZI
MRRHLFPAGLSFHTKEDVKMAEIDEIPFEELFRSQDVIESLFSAFRVFIERKGTLPIWTRFHVVKNRSSASARLLRIVIHFALEALDVHPNERGVWWNMGSRWVVLKRTNPTPRRQGGILITDVVIFVIFLGRRAGLRGTVAVPKDFCKPHTVWGRPGDEPELCRALDDRPALVISTECPE